MNRLFLLLFGAVTFVVHAHAQVPEYVPTEGLVAWYPFNGNANDESGNGNDGEVVGATEHEDRFGNASSALNFANAADWVDVPTISTGSEYTIQAWALFPLPSTADGHNTFVSDWNPGAEADLIFMTFHESCGLAIGDQYAPGNCVQGIYGVELIASDVDDGWHLVTTVVSGGQTKFYLDGILLDTIDHTISGTIEAIGNNTADQGVAPQNAGIIDDVGIWNRALTEGEIQTLYVEANDETSMTPTTQAGLFDGDDYIWLTDQDFLNFGQSSFTGHVQFRANDLSSLNECCGYQTLIAKGAAGGTGEKGFNLDLRGEPEDARIKCNLTTAPGINVILDAPIVENEWYDLVFIVDWSAEVASLYVNGTFVDEGSLEELGNMNNSWYPTIGRYVWNNTNEYDAHFFLGEIAKIRFLEGADYDLGHFPCTERENVLFQVNEFTADEIATQVSSIFAVEEVISTITTCSSNLPPGCTDPTSCNYDVEATSDDGSCIPAGCMEPLACNYNALAECAGEACDYTCCPGPGCCLDGTTWDADLGGCVPNDIPTTSCPHDIDFDGLIGVVDLMDLLSVFGTDCPEAGDPAGDPETAEFTCGDPVNYHGYNYATVQIGAQCWFAENLRAELYRNGDSIPGNLSNDEWAEATQGAMAWPNNDEATVLTYGVFYNGHALFDERGLCPDGWDVSNWEEFLELADFAGGVEVGCSPLKSVDGWPTSPLNLSGTDEFGFSGLPSGYRQSNGTFVSIHSGYWSNSLQGESVWNWGLGNHEYIYVGYGSVNAGLSIRCLKDE